MQIITPPVAEPIALNEAITHLRQDQGVDDARISASIVAARVAAENATWHTLVGTRYKQFFDAFPCVITLDRTPVLIVESIEYLGQDGTVHSVPLSDCAISYGQPCRITPKFGTVWPIPVAQIGSVSVTFVAGCAAPISASGDVITVRGPWNALDVGDVVRFSNSGGDLPVGLSVATDYRISEIVSSNSYKVTKDGNPVSLTDSGSGISFIGEIPSDIRVWMLLRIGTLDALRSEMASNTEYNFADSYLSGYSTW